MNLKVIMINLLIILNLSGCCQIGDFCLLYEPVYFSASKDTPETIEAIRRNNAVYSELCD